MDSHWIIDRLYIFLMFIPILAVHEAAHAWVAHLLGDDTAKNEGRLTLNPASHIDPFGTLIIPAINIFLSQGGIGLIGWGKPVPVDVSQLRNYRRDEALIALAGPVANLFLALAALAAQRFLIPLDASLGELTRTFAYVSVFLAVFNLIPIPPLDGWNIFKNLFRLPGDLAERGGFWWFLALIILINLPPVMNALHLITNQILHSLDLLTGA